jgi:hypothetical protein
VRVVWYKQHGAQHGLTHQRLSIPKRSASPSSNYSTPNAGEHSRSSPSPLPSPLQYAEDVLENFTGPNSQQQNQQQQQGPQNNNIPPPPPQNGQNFTLSTVLHFLQTEWRGYERDRNEWEIERAEMRVRPTPSLTPSTSSDLRHSNTLNASLGTHSVARGRAALLREREARLATSHKNARVCPSHGTVNLCSIFRPSPLSAH